MYKKFNAVANIFCVEFPSALNTMSHTMPLFFPSSLHSLIKSNFNDSARRPAHCFLTLSSSGIIALLPFVSAFAFGDEARLVRDSGLALIFLSLFAASSVSNFRSLREETDSGTIQLVLSKPVSRLAFLTAHAAGLLALLWLLLICLWPALILSCAAASTDEQNRFLSLSGVFLPLCAAAASCVGAWRSYFSRKSFCAAFSAVFPVLLWICAAVVLIKAPAGSEIRSSAWAVCAQVLMFACASLPLCVISVILSAFFRQTAAILSTLVVFACGLLIPQNLDRTLSASSISIWTASLIIAPWQLYWLSDPSAAGIWEHLPSSLLWTALYSIVYSFFLASVAGAILRASDIR